MHTSPPSFSIADLCRLTDLPLRTVRYYVQIGLVDRPEGETRSARYGQKQLEQLLQIRKWTAAGLSLTRIRELLDGADSGIPMPSNAPGSIAVRSHIAISQGIELVIDPQQAGLSPQQLRELIQKVLDACTQIKTNESGGTQ